MNKARNGFIAALLSFLQLGLGHLYCGEIKRGVVICLAGLVLSACGFLVPVLSWGACFFIGLFVSNIGLLIFCVADAVIIARKKRNAFNLKKYNKWWVYLAVWAIMALGLDSSLRHFQQRVAYDLYLTAAGSMSPTLFPNEWVLVSKHAEAQLDDIVVFLYLDDPILFMQRLVAMPGDTVEILGGELLINNSFVDGRHASFLKRKNQSKIILNQDNFGPIVVPEGMGFILGDNRDNSYDSRFRGCVSLSEIQGKAKGVVFSWDKQNSRVRWSRVGRNIH